MVELLDSEGATDASTVRSSAFLTGKLAGLRRKVLTNSILTSLSVALLVGVEVLGLTMFLDWWLELPATVRAALFAIEVLGLGWLLAKYAIGPLVRQPTDEELALALEKARPQLRTRLIASVQLTRPQEFDPFFRGRGRGTSTISAAGMSFALIEALVEETEAIAANIDFTTIVPAERLRTIAVAAGCVLAVALAVFIYGQPTTSQLLKRALLYNVPVPRKTRVEVAGGSRVAGRGDNVRIEAYASGVIPRRGWLDTRSPGRAQRYEMQGDAGVFNWTIENVQDSFEYQVRLNDGRSGWFTIKVLPRPSVISMACEQIFPPYTQLPPRTPAIADLSLLAGSDIRISVVASKEIAGATMKLVGDLGGASTRTRTKDEDDRWGDKGAGARPLDKVGDKVGLESKVAMEVIGAREVRGEFRVPARGMNGFSLHLLDRDGMESAEAAVYRVDIVPDKAPSVRIRSPSRREELFTRQATAVIGMEVRDDFQISKLRLRYKGEGDDDATARVVELDIGPGAVKNLERRFEWKMSSVAGMAGDGGRIEFWIEAEDNNDVTGPGVGASERYVARLVTEEEKRADLWNRASDSLSGIHDLAGDQEKLNQGLGRLIREKAGGGE